MQIYCVCVCVCIHTEDFCILLIPVHLQFVTRISWRNTVDRTSLFHLQILIPIKAILIMLIQKLYSQFLQRLPSSYLGGLRHTHELPPTENFCNSNYIPGSQCHHQEWLSHLSMIGELLSLIKSQYLVVQGKLWYLL